MSAAHRCSAPLLWLASHYPSLHSRLSIPPSSALLPPSAFPLPQASTSVRGLLVHLKSTSRDGGLVSHLVEGLTLLYDEAQEQHGDEEPTVAAGA